MATNLFLLSAFVGISLAAPQSQLPSVGARNRGGPPPEYPNAAKCDFVNQCSEMEDCFRGYCIPGSSKKHLQYRMCRFDYECPNQWSCKSDFTCYSGANPRSHLEGVRCAHDGQCPYGWQCNKMTCWEKEPRNHVQRVCIFDFECPGNFDCIKGICYEGAKVNHIEGRLCTYDYHCPSGHGCGQNQYTCYADGSEHQESLCGIDSQCPSGNRCKDYTCVSKPGTKPWLKFHNSRGGGNNGNDYDYQDNPSVGSSGSGNGREHPSVGSSGPGNDRNGKGNQQEGDHNGEAHPEEKEPKEETEPKEENAPTEENKPEENKSQEGTR